jgi:hypothetical protein
VKKIIAMFPVAIVGLVVATQGPADAAQGPEVKTTQFAVESGLLDVIFAKELCSCHFVDGISYNECLATANLPGDATKIVDVDIDEQAHTVSADFNFFARFVSSSPGRKAVAAFDPAQPQFGCVEVEGPAVP